MPPTNRYALKEWAVVCAALAQGRQTLLLRKGGIAEGPDGFVVEHPEFWLFPTRFHQSADELQPGAADLLQNVQQAQTPEGIVRLSLYGVVDSVSFLEDEASLSPIESEHILSPQTAIDRFRYRHPGLFVMTLRVFRTPQPIEIHDDPAFAGCHSWVDLGEDLPTDGLAPVLSDIEFTERRDHLVATLSDS